MLKSCRFLAILVAAVFCAACVKDVSTSESSVIDAQNARKFSDAFMEDFANDRQDAMYSKMEKEFHEFMPRDKFGDLTRTLNGQFGKITIYKFDSDEVGIKTLYNGTIKPSRRMVYQATTTKGRYPCIVTVVPNGNDLAVTEFVYRIEFQ